MISCPVNCKVKTHLGGHEGLKRGPKRKKGKKPLHIHWHREPRGRAEGMNSMLGIYPRAYVHPEEFFGLYKSRAFSERCGVGERKKSNVLPFLFLRRCPRVTMKLNKIIK